jgi:TolA-binding protein
VAQTYIFLSDWQNAVTALQETIEKYKDKIRMDGLMMDMALIYHRELKDKIKARETLEKLLAEYPDSQLVKTATAFLKELDKK